ncbi:MAG: aspartate-semialdehyde dehydrogenase [Candidatus Xenobiia bacterium LiM19]
MKKINVAVVGATGLVGTAMIRVLEERDFPVDTLRAFATSRSAGSIVSFKGRDITVEDIESSSFKGVHCALFSGGEIASSVYAPKAVKDGAIVIDNSASFRMDRDVPLVVPEVNAQAAAGHKGIIANPNCSTIQMVLVLKPIYDAAGIARVIVTTFQAVSGTGKAAVEELEAQMKAILGGKPFQTSVYPHQIAFNVLPQIGDFESDGYSKEEKKMILETQKIMGDETLRISATTVRVPVKVGHSESINIETKEKITASKVRELLRKAPGVVVVDEPGKSRYPLPIDAAGHDEVLVGRIRDDLSCEKGIELWIAADNLRKGAATNAVQIGEILLEKGLL